ncbi:MAG TPA: MBL fold metallo-hydrolase [Candidatus Polarisedimenticolia bacterium]|nr:MBL fold metallo-hydrolase [Candidatus Polarisedimenticolia bacterium]
MNETKDPLYFRQLLAGRDFARADSVAAQMLNFAYLIGDRDTKECFLVDPAWDVASLVSAARNDGMNVVGALASHYHPDPVGGDMMGYRVEGVRRLLEIVGVKIHVHDRELPWVKRITGLSASDLKAHAGGDVLQVGKIPVEFLHTPGHTEGSACFLVAGNRLVAGDTLFVGSCGRVDLPGSDPEEMYRTLTQRLSTLPDEVVLYPGHDYGDRPTSTLGQERRSNYSMKVPTLSQWLSMMGGPTDGP